VNTAVLANRLSDKEKEDLLKEILGAEYSSVGNNLPILKSAIDVIGHFDTAFSLAELVPFINNALSSSRVFGFVASGASVFSIFMFPVASMISVINAYQVGHQMYSYRAIAYTLTAWAFGKPIPVSSQKILSNLREGNLVAKQKIASEYKQLWQKTSQSVLTKLNSELTSKKIPKEAVQIILRAISNDNPQVLCELLEKGFEDKMSHITKLTWKSNYSIKFPG
jgi:hypothetical protein